MIKVKFKLKKLMKKTMKIIHVIMLTVSNS